MVGDGVMAFWHPSSNIFAILVSSPANLLLVSVIPYASISFAHGFHACNYDHLNAFFGWTVSWYALVFSKLEGQNNHSPIDWQFAVSHVYMVALGPQLAPKVHIDVLTIMQGALFPLDLQVVLMELHTQYSSLIGI